MLADAEVVAFSTTDEETGLRKDNFGSGTMSCKQDDWRNNT